MKAFYLIICIFTINIVMLSLFVPSAKIPLPKEIALGLVGSIILFAAWATSEDKKP